MIFTIILITAFILDFFLGDPPNRFHPVAWIGRWIGLLWDKRPSLRFRLFFHGILITISGLILFALPLTGLRYLPDSALILVSIPLLKLSFSIRNLLGAADEVKKKLSDGELSAAREATSRHLVSRDTSLLSENEIAAAVIESTAENITDSFMSPLFFFLIFGLPGAWAYRYINTCDAMIGYRKDDYEWGGKFAARLDDVMNFIPARITAVVIMIAGIRTRNFSEVFIKTLRNRRKTDSPNAGWTMSAVASLLDIRLEKKGYYVINDSGREPTACDITTCIKICRTASLMIMILLIISGIIIYGL